ncbi:MAG: serine--tRNA ligase [Patescibacteria group bacterium]
MIDLDYLRAHVDEVKQNCANRKVKVDLEKFLDLDQQRVTLIQNIEQIRGERNSIAEHMPKANKEEKPGLAAKAKQLKEQVQQAEAELQTIETDWRNIWMTIPNLTHPDTPIGGEDKNKILHTWEKPTHFDFAPRTHLELGEKWDLMDFERAAEVSGQKFYYLKNEGALLEMALTRFAVDQAMKAGFSLMLTPDLARPSVLEGTGYQPRGPETQIYSIEGHDLALIGTAEITIGGYHQKTTFEAADLPKKYVGVSHCFRTESGAYGKESRGLYRIHQFTKVELFVFCTPEQSEQFHTDLLAVEESIFQALEIPYQVIDNASADLGGPAYRKFDIEGWMPFKNAYGELTSTSNLTDFQARRLQIKYKEGKKSQFVHMLNGTAVAIPRTIIAILENNQNQDGTIQIPAALQPYMNGKKVIGQV